MSSIDNILRVGDYGIPIVITVLDRATDDPVDLSIYTTKTFKFKKYGSDVIVSKTASHVTDGKDGKVQYITESGFLDVAGRWKVQVVLVATGTATLTSDPAEFEVLANL